MSKFMIMIRRRKLLLLLCMVIWSLHFLSAAPKEITQSTSIKAFGTGMTTGHVADIVVKNKSKTALTILPQRVFIPSTGQYQPYIADIPSAIIQAGSTDTIRLQGYCTDVHLAAAPAALELIPIIKWIPIRQPDSTLVGEGTYLVVHNSVVPFTKDHIGYIITSNAYSPIYPPPDSMHIVSWPDTDIPAGGRLNHLTRPDLYATIMSKVLEVLEAATNEIQLRKTLVTPFTINPGKERDAIIQQVIWMYASALAGKQYGKEEFRTKVYEEFKSRDGLNDIPALEKQELDEGIDEFWNVFLTVTTETKLFQNKEKLSVTGALVDLPMDTIQYPWSMITMTDIFMKPGFVKYIPVKVSDPVIPIIAGTVSVGTLLFIAFHDHHDDTTCTFSISLETTPSSCDLENGTINLSSSIDTDFTYAWSNGADSKDLVGVAPGNYSVTVTRTGTTCSQSTQAIVDNLNPPVNTTITTTEAHCGGQDGSATVTVDPAGLYSYSWSNGSVDQNQSSLAAGNYTVIVTASGTCADTSTITINDLPPSFNADISSSSAHCGQSDGSATVDVSPAGEYHYQWSEGSTTSSISGLTAGTYSVTVTENGTGCTAVKQIDVDASSPSFTINVSTTDASCGMSDGTASATVDPAGEYTYAWSNGQTTSQASGLPPGDYTIKVSIPGTECIDSMQITIGELPPNYVINTTTTPASCGLTDGTATASVDPPGAYVFNWSNGQSVSQATGLAVGMYTVTVSLPGNLCVQTADVSISQLPPPFTLTSGSTPASCGLIDGTATASVDPPGEYNYMWSNGQITDQATGLAAGTYSVTVTIPGTTCQQSLSISVDQLPASFTINTSSTSAHCGLNDGTASVVPSPSGEYLYLWSDGQTTPQAAGLIPGNYSVTVTIVGTSCQRDTSFTIGQLPPSFTVNTSSTAAHCGLNDGTVTALVDPAGEYTYQWSGGQSGAQITALAAGEYVVSVSLVGSSCFVSDTIVVDQIPLSLTPGFDVTLADCGVANGSSTLTVDPAGNYAYTWSNKQTGNVLQQVPAGNYDVTITDNNSCTASFSTSIGEKPAHYLDILSTSPATCVGGGEISFTLSGPGTGPFSVEINAPGGPVSLTLSPGSYLLSAFINIVPGAYNFIVYDQGIGSACSDTQSAQVSDQTPGIIIVNDAYSTQSDQPVSGNVLQNDSGLNLQLTSITNIVGGNVSFTSDGNFTYTPDSGFSGTGSFTYTLMDACGNTTSGTAVITVQMVACTITITQTLTPANCDLNNGAISVSVNEAGNYQYNWSNGQTGSTINDIAAGSYTVTIQETGSNCSANFTLDLTEYPANYISNVIITQPAGMDPGEIQFTLNTQGSVPFLSVSVDYPNGLQTFTIEPGVVVLSDYIDIVPGSYTIEAFIGDAGPDCVDDFSAIINTPPIVENMQNVVFSLGMALVNSPITTAHDQPVSASPGSWNTSVLGTMDYSLGKRTQHIRVLYSPPYSDLHFYHPAWMQVEHLSELMSLHQKQYSFSLNGGMGFRPVISGYDFDPLYFSLNANTHLKVGKILRLQAEVSLQGWSKLEPLQWMMTVSIPFLN